MEFKAKLILDRDRFELELDDESFNHGLKVCDMYIKNKTKNFKSKTFRDAYIKALDFATLNDTDSIILVYKDDKYKYISIVASSFGRFYTDLLVTALDGSGSDVEINSFDVMNGDIDELFEKEVSSWD